MTLTKNLIARLEYLRDTMDTYHDLLSAEIEGVGDHQYLKEGAGRRLPEKPRKNIERIGKAIDALRNDATVQARTWLRAVYGSWRDHIGLHEHYIDTNQMTVAHVLSHFGGHLTEDQFSLPHDYAVRSILINMQQIAIARADEFDGPDAFSLGVALCAALKEVDMLIA